MHVFPKVRHTVLTLALTCSFATSVFAEVKPIAGWDQQLFPSYIVATSTLKSHAQPTASESIVGDPLGLLGVELDGAAGKNVQVTIECPALLEPSVFSGELPDGETCAVYPQIRWRYDRLTAIDQSTPAHVTFRVEIDGESMGERTVPVTVRSINDCPIVVREGEGVNDVGFTFAAYVNEEHPFVDKLLREALDSNAVNGFTGYQSKDPHEIVRQVYAIWHALSMRDMRYSSITATAAESEMVASQHVRLIEQSINNSQANCVDGAVLFASALRKIGLDAFLVLTSNHCYVGFHLAPDRSSPALALETTLIGATPLEDVTETALDDAIDPFFHGQTGWLNFAQALDVGTADYKTRKDALQADAPPSDSPTGAWQSIYIADARKVGILPIPFRANEKFDWNRPSAGNADDTPTDDEDKTEAAERKRRRKKKQDESQTAAVKKPRPGKGRGGRSGESNDSSGTTTTTTTEETTVVDEYEEIDGAEAESDEETEAADDSDADTDDAGGDEDDDDGNDMDGVDDAEADGDDDAGEDDAGDDE